MFSISILQHFLLDSNSDFFSFLFRKETQQGFGLLEDMGD